MIMRITMDHVSIRTASSASSTCGGPCRHRNSRRPLQSHSPRHRNHRAVTPRRFRACTTDSHHDLPVAPNRLSQNFAASRPDQIWLADITYVPLYLAAVPDLFTRKIVGWGCEITCRLSITSKNAKQMATAKWRSSAVSGA
jgi:transposase InsO family protein